jgi:GTP-sensing pleiotropic transcriptional regulator CodY
MSENKTGKYLKYAIGEIILVMIGILLALQVNNWNERRKDRIKEQVVLKQLQEDYQANLMQLEEKMTTRDRIIYSAMKLLKAFDQPAGIIRDSLVKELANAFHDPTYDPIQNDLTSSGNLILIRNHKLKRLLSNWSSDVVGVREIEATWSTTK